MATIHHATAKKAAKLGMEIVATMHAIEVTDPTLAATWAFPLDYLPSSALEAAQNARTLQNEHGVKITEKSGIYTARIGRKNPLAAGPDLLDVTQDAFVKIAEAANSKRAAKGEETEAEGEETTRGSVVKAKYRAIYKEAGHPDHCGDEMAQLFIDYMDGAEGEAAAAKLELLAHVNGLDDSWAKWSADRSVRGWIGRARMNLGNVLRGRARKIAAGKEGVPEIVWPANS